MVSDTSSPIYSPQTRSEPRMSSSSIFLEDEELAFLSQRSEKPDQPTALSGAFTQIPLDKPASNGELPKDATVDIESLHDHKPKQSICALMMVIPREIFGALVLDSISLIGGILGAFKRWASGLWKRFKTCVISTAGLIVAL